MPGCKSASACFQSNLLINLMNGCLQDINHNVEVPSDKVASEIPNTIYEVIPNGAIEKLKNVLWDTNFVHDTVPPTNYQSRISF